MDGPDYPQPEQRGTTGTGKTGRVPSLIHDYRAQRDAWREQARNLARMREEVLAAADREAQDIVTSARASIREILLKARRDLLVLAAQVRAAGRLGDGEDSPDVTFLPGDDLGQAHNTLTTARHDIRRVLDESRPELEGLVAEGEALRSALRPPAPRPVAAPPREPRWQFSPAPFDNLPARPEPAVDFEFTTMASSESEEFAIRKRPPVRTFIAAVATLGTIAVMGTTWWLFRPDSKTVQPSTADSKPVDSKASASVTAPASGVKRAATTSATGTTPTASDGWMRRSPIPDPRSPTPVSIGLSARRASWIRVMTDGRVTAERIFKAGETQLISGTREVSIRAGDAGAVMVSVSGRQPVALGREGEVVTRKFAAETPRAERAAPAPPVTPRPSPQVPIAQAAPQRTPTSTVAPPASTAAAPNPTRVAPQQTATATPPVTTPSLPPPAASAPPRPAAIALDRQPVSATPTPAAASPLAASPQISLQNSLANEASRFLDAYYRQDRGTMASISTQVNVNDDRPDKERLPRGLTGVRRTLEDVNLQVIGPEAMLTARMTERMENLPAGQSAQAVSYVSHMWTQRNGTWQLHDVRIVSASSLKGTLR